MQRIVRLVLLAILLFALVLFARGIDWPETWRVMKGASPLVLAIAAVINLASLALKGVRWWLFLRPIGVSSLILVLRATFAGAALNNILIANAGEAGRVLLVSRAADVPSEKVLATLALERLFEFAGYVVMLAAAVSLLHLPPALSDLRPYAFAALALLMALLIYLTRHPEQAELPDVGRVGFVGRAMQYGRGFFRALTNISTGRRFSGAMLIAVVVWTMQVATYQLTARAAHFAVPVVATIAAILAVNLGFAVRATPGNVGVFQAIYAITVAAFGMDKDTAIGVALLIQAQQIIPITVIGLLAAPEIVREWKRRP